MIHNCPNSGPYYNVISSCAEAQTLSSYCDLKFVMVVNIEHDRGQEACRLMHLLPSSDDLKIHQPFWKLGAAAEQKRKEAMIMAAPCAEICHDNFSHEKLHANGDSSVLKTFHLMDGRSCNRKIQSFFQILFLYNFPKAAENLRCIYNQDLGLWYHNEAPKIIWNSQCNAFTTIARQYMTVQAVTKVKNEFEYPAPIC